MSVRNVEKGRREPGYSIVIRVASVDDGRWLLVCRRSIIIIIEIVGGCFAQVDRDAVFAPPHQVIRCNVIRMHTCT